jgi:hypothetical protein
LVSIAAFLFSLCAAASLSPADWRETSGATAVQAVYEARYEVIFLDPFPTLSVKPSARFFAVDGRGEFQKIRFGPSLSLDREGRLFVDFNPSISFGIKPEMGSLSQWAESLVASDLLRSLSVSMYVRY